MTTSFSGALDPEPSALRDATVAGSDGVLVLDAAQRCISADTVFAHIFDVDPQSLAGRTLGETALPAPLVAVLSKTADAAVAANGARRAQVSIDDGGATRTFTILALPAADQVSLIVWPCGGAGTGESSTQTAERHAHLRAEAALFMRDQVLSVVSHDLRGPLNAIHSWGYVLERKIDAADPAAQRALTGIRSGVEQQVKLIETTVDTARAETKVLALTLQPWAIRTLVERSAALARGSLANGRGVAIEVESPLAEEQIEGDAERLTQALWLMLAFATEASARGSSIVFASIVEGSSWRSTVHFTASAAALMDKQVPHALEAVARKQATATREAGRIAWALALCKRVAEAHGGSFEQGDIVDGAAVSVSMKVPLSGM
ncbi:histidine kinase [Caballeronia terrestris]|uniref:histidine kinase n=1 Tax=Caballeronia terrestris TaxID=1226301 RepID=A0A158GBT7_9BURK|nr:HAMP domain-containing sensor histidine kinase [Caballeronia terrestris]SAL28840.1 histidine kinase [Caballeronia terrestris]